MFGLRSLSGALAIALFTLAPVQVAPPARADDYTYSDYDSDNDYLVDRIEDARRNPLLLDNEFFAMLSRTEPRSAPRYAFEANLRHIDWYQVPEARAYVYDHYPREYDQFLRDNRIGVMIVSPDNPFLARVLSEQIAETLPEYARLVRKKKRADILLVVEELRFDQSTDDAREPRTKQYKKKYRKHPDPAQRLIRATFTRVKETISADYYYRITVRNRDYVLDQVVLDERARRSFTYGEDITVVTAAGAQNGTPQFYPSKKVRSLLERDIGAAREEAMNEIRAHVMSRLVDTVSHLELPYRRHLRHTRR